MKRIRVLGLAVLITSALVATSCGGGRSSNASDSGEGGAAKASATSFGDLESPCGSGAATGATAQGVTDTSITIGYGDDAGYPSTPGLNKAQSDAMRAIIKWCNDQGGINGRKVDGKYYDAKIMEINNVMTEACSQVFFLVGEGWSLDASGEVTRRGCNLPAVPSWAVSPPFSNGPDVYQSFPVPADYTIASPAYQLAELFPDKVKKAATIAANYSATQDSKDKVTSAYPQAGWTFLDCAQTYNIQGEADWRPYAQRLKDCGAEIVYFTGSPSPNFINLLTAANQVGFRPIWLGDVNLYDPVFLNANSTGIADNVYFRVSAVPFEEAASNPATQQFIDVLKAAGYDDPSVLGVQSVSAFLLWATASKECGSDLTRACVIEKLKATHEWTGGGLHAVSDPGGNVPSTCGALIKMNGTTVERIAPAEVATYECDPRFAAKTSGAVLERAKLDSNRIAAAN